MLAGTAVLILLQAVPFHFQRPSVKFAYNKASEPMDRLSKYAGPSYSIAARQTDFVDIAAIPGCGLSHGGSIGIGHGNQN